MAEEMKSGEALGHLRPLLKQVQSLFKLEPILLAGERAEKLLAEVDQRCARAESNFQDTLRQIGVQNKVLVKVKDDVGTMDTTRQAMLQKVHEEIKVVKTAASAELDVVVEKHGKLEKEVSHLDGVLKSARLDVQERYDREELAHQAQLKKIVGETHAAEKKLEALRREAMAIAGR